jgi:transposase
MLSELVKRNTELEQKNTTLEKKLEASEIERRRLELKLEGLKEMLFGRRSEKITPEVLGHHQLELFEEAKAEVEAEEEPEQDEPATKRKKKRKGRKPLPKELRRERIVLDVDPEIRTCSCCNKAFVRIGEDITEELEFIPASLYVIEYVRPKYACSDCEVGVLMEPLPLRPIEKGRPGPGLLAHVVVSKYSDCLPLYRQEKIFARSGVKLARSTLCDWVAAVAVLLAPIVEVMKRELLRAALLQADETPINVQDPAVKGRLTRAYIWTYGIPWGETVYDFTLGRSAKGPEKFLKDFEGYLQTDAYSGYNSVCRTGAVVHVACWAHVRRRFYNAIGEAPELAKLVLAGIQKLYRIERRAKEEGVCADALVELRRREAKPILDSLKGIMASKSLQVLPKSALGTAIHYALAQWDALARYVDVAEAEIDNNSAEHSMRTVVMNRKNWLFVGSPEAGPRAAVLLSLVETCRRLKLDPFRYLRWAIEEITQDPSRAAELTPRKWRELERARKAEKAAEGSVG